MTVELKTVIVKDGVIEIVDYDENIHGILEGEVKEIKMQYTDEFGWRELNFVKEPTKEELLEAKIKYLAIMTGVEL